MYTKGSTRHQREIAWMKTDGHCAYCGKKLNPFRFHVDHMVPRSQGGTNAPDNLAAACSTCNHRKKAKTVEEFREYLGPSMGDRITKMAEDLKDWGLYYDYDMSPYIQKLDECATEMEKLHPHFYFERHS